MSTRYEGADADAVSVDMLRPLERVGEYELKPGEYGVQLNYDEVFYITGSPADIVNIGEQIAELGHKAQGEQKQPLTLDSIVPDIDGDWACPRCDKFWPRSDEHASFGAILRAIQQHIDEHNGSA